MQPRAPFSLPYCVAQEVSKVLAQQKAHEDDTVVEREQFVAQCEQLGAELEAVQAQRRCERGAARVLPGCELSPLCISMRVADREAAAPCLCCACRACRPDGLGEGWARELGSKRAAHDGSLLC